MVSVKPRSILQLTITGFLSVTGLLVVALLITSRQLDDLSERNLSLVDQSTNALNLGGRLSELISAMDRNARQYNVLQDPAMLALYQERQSAFNNTVFSLNQLELNTALQEMLGDIEKLEREAFQALASASPQQIEMMYREILAIANNLVSEINAWSNLQINEIARETADAQRLLTFQAVVLVGTALILAAVFTTLITRPLLQVDEAIDRLGTGGYKENIQIRGPRDLVNLGTKLEWLRERLASLEQQRSSFLRHVSHELKTPLAAIKESASLLNDGVIGKLDPRQKDILDIQLKNTRRLQELIDELLRHHLESFAVINVMPTPVNLHTLIEDVVKSHDVTIRSARLKIRKSLAKVTFMGNQEQLRVALDNLLSNAIKYSPPGGTIELLLSPEGSQTIIEIADEGPGIRPEQSEQIFDAFYQGEPPDNDIYQGSGLGLAIAREYIQANGGKIALANGNHGARFRITLPGNGEDKA